MSLKLEGHSENEKSTLYKLVSYRMPTPDGTMFVNIYEDDNYNFQGLNITIGKAGTSLRAYLLVLSEFITVMIRGGISIYKVIEILSAQKTDRSTFISNNRSVSSGAEALFIILTNYNSEKIAAEENGKHKAVGYFTKKREKRA